MHIARQLQAVSQTRLKSISSRQHNEQGEKVSQNSDARKASEELQNVFLPQISKGGLQGRTRQWVKHPNET